ncbi:MAG: hypothetical protein F6K41_18510 [Symploca sp. SIO3E6]|nr:hypothetical protein [Caldora sp. SIO3E6]
MPLSREQRSGGAEEQRSGGAEERRKKNTIFLNPWSISLYRFNYWKMRKKP